MQPGNDKDAAIDDASLKLLKSYLMARRDFLKVSLTYYYAGLVQGESGGRAIISPVFNSVESSITLIINLLKIYQNIQTIYHAILF